MNFLYWFLCVLIGFLPALLLFRKDRKKNIPVKWLPALLRFFIFFFTAALLLAPAFPGRKNVEEKPLLVWLQDNSLSMNQALGSDSAQYRQKTEALWRQLGRDYELVKLGFGSYVLQDSLFDYYQKSTNISAALQMVSQHYHDRNLGAVILSGDGNFNEGLNPLYMPLSLKAPVHTVGLGDSSQPVDAAVVAIHANKLVALNSTFEIIADIAALKLEGETAELSLLHRGRIIAQRKVAIQQERFSASLRFEVAASQEGMQQYTVILSKTGNESNILNNRMDAFVEVVENKREVLIWAAAPHPDIAAIKEALEGQEQFKISVKYGNQGSINTEAYDLIIAHQLPARSGWSMPDLKQVPLWFILGSQSNLGAFASLQNSLSISGGGRTNEVLPVIQPAFSSFSLPTDIQEVVDKMPPLDAPAGTFQVGGNTRVLFNQQIGRVPTDYPLWMLQAGERPVAVLAGTGLWRWRLFEYKNFEKHEVVDDLICQTVYFLSAKQDKRPFKVIMDKHIFNDNEAVTVWAELRNDNGELVNAPQATLNIQDSSGRSLDYEFEKDGNRYRLSPGLLAPGSYTFEGKTDFNGKTYKSSGLFHIESLPLEYLQNHSDYALMYQLAQESGGHFFTVGNMMNLADSIKADQNIKPVIHTDKTYFQLIGQRWIFFLILVFAAAEWLLRKYWNL